MIRSTIKNRSTGLNRKDLPEFIRIVKNDFKYTSNTLAERFAGTLEDLATKCDTRGLISTVYGKLDDKTAMFGLFHCVEESDGKVAVSYVTQTLSAKNTLLQQIPEPDIKSATDELCRMGVNILSVPIFSPPGDSSQGEFITKMSVVTWRPRFEPLESNPFTALFPTRRAASDQRNQTQKVYTSNAATLNDIIELIMQVTLVDRYQVTLVDRDQESRTFLPALAKTSAPQDWLDLEIVDEAMKERLVLVSKSPTEWPTGINYLFACHLRYTESNRNCAKGEHLKKKYLSAIHKVIGEHASEAFKSPHAPAHNLFWGILTGDKMQEAVDFLENAMESNTTGKEPRNLLRATFSRIDREIRKITLDNIMLQEGRFLELVSLMATRPHLGSTIVRLSTPTSTIPFHADDPPQGRLWETGILGMILSISMVVKPRGGKPLFFTEKPSTITVEDFHTQQLSATTSTKLLFTHLCNIWKGLLKAGPTSKHLALRWIGDCLKDNSLRSSELATVPGWPGNASLAQSGFLINLGLVLLELCQPFCSDPTCKKLVEVKADYCQAEDADVLEDPTICCCKGGRGLHMTGLQSETSLVPREGQDENAVNVVSQHGFVSDMFFMTQKCLYIGLNQANKELDKMNKDLETYRDIEKVVKEGKEVFIGTAGPMHTPIRINSVEQLNYLKDKILTPFYCLQTAMTLPFLLDRLSNFTKATSMWLLQQSVGCIRLNQNGASLILPEEPPTSLSRVPELVMHNINNYIRLARMPHPATPSNIPVLPVEFSEQILNLLVILMSSSWLKNPHMRAKLAKTLSLLLPQDKRASIRRSAGLLQPDVAGPLLQPSSTAPNTIFEDLPQKKELFTAILNVFVGIDVANSEEAMIFEQKFMYRYPINSILFHLFKLEEYREVLIEIADKTHKNMADQRPHLYLRFVSALVNDGTWLLDEALAAMKKIKEINEEMNSAHWNGLPDQEKAVKLKDLQEAKEHALSLNALSTDNLQMISSLTKLTTQVFGHSDMVGRLAVMLNHFLKNITGKTRKQFVVKDAEQFYFHPKELIKYLCTIYQQLSSRDNFIKAIADDGRSYSPDLFKQAETILKKVGTWDEVEQLREMAAKVDKQFTEVSTADAMEDVPFEFMDPLMATLMREPVFLPSGNTVDRSTVARLILDSSQDPFNRQPFTLDMIKPNLELQEKVTEWLKGNRNPGGSGKSTPSTAGSSDIVDDYEEDNSDAENKIKSDENENKVSSGETEDIVKRDEKEVKIKIDENENKVRGGQNPPVTVSMSGQLLPRIRRDILEICREAPDGIFVLPDEEDMTKIHAVITGPPDTPYEGGFFYFVLNCPSNYPAGPPKATLLTTGGGRVRFNPNLYRNGKVCLSILGTWKGPGWSPALSLLSVLLSIQSLMNEKPYHNEPGLEKERNVGDSDRYNEIIRHETVRVAVIEALESPDKGMPEDLVDQIRDAATATLRKHIETCEDRSHMSGVTMQDPVMENKGTFQWSRLKQRLLALRANLLGGN